MCGPGDGGFGDEEVDPDAVLWVRGVDYVSGWRDARDAAAELEHALTAVGLAMEGTALRASSGPGGSGVVRLELPVSAARELAMLARVAAARWRRKAS